MELGGKALLSKGEAQGLTPSTTKKKEKVLWIRCSGYLKGRGTSIAWAGNWKSAWATSKNPSPKGETASWYNKGTSSLNSGGALLIQRLHEAILCVRGRSIVENVLSPSCVGCSTKKVVSISWTQGTWVIYRPCNSVQHRISQASLATKLSSYYNAYHYCKECVPQHWHDLGWSEAMCGPPQFCGLRICLFSRP
jgi:hypothetical protein